MGEGPCHFPVLIRWHQACTKAFLWAALLSTWNRSWLVTPKGPPPSLGPAVCVLCALVPFPPLDSWVGWLSFSPITLSLQGTNTRADITNRSQVLSPWSLRLGSTSNPGMMPLASHTPPSFPQAPSEGFHRKGKRWLPSQESGHRLVRRQKLRALELTWLLWKATRVPSGSGIKARLP